MFKTVMKSAFSHVGIRVHKMGVVLDRQRTVGGLPYSTVLPFASYSPWLIDGEFNRVYGIVSDSTLVDKYRCYELWELAGQISQLKGDILEVGVWRGGTGALIAAKAKSSALQKTVYLCDTFSGVVKASEKDTSYAGGEHADATVDGVKHLLDRLALDNVQILRGIFPDDFAAEMQNASFSFIHIDVDVHQSAKDVMSFAWPRLVTGGVVVFDDFGFDTCDGIAKLVAEYRGNPDKIVLHNLNGHAILIKTA